MEECQECNNISMRPYSMPNHSSKPSIVENIDLSDDLGNGLLNASLAGDADETHEFSFDAFPDENNENVDKFENNSSIEEDAKNETHDLGFDASGVSSTTSEPNNCIYDAEDHDINTADVNENNEHANNSKNILSIGDVANET